MGTNCYRYVPARLGGYILGDYCVENEPEEYGYLIKRFGRDKIAKRFDFVNNLLKEYIIQNEYTDKVFVSENTIEHIIIDYFVDIDRMKDFQEIKYTNQIKIYAYLSYWILRHKPLQIIQGVNDDELVFVNEAFTADFLSSFLFSEPANIPFISEQREKIDDFIKTLEYYFCYRDYTAKSIELVLLAFGAGRGYQYSVDYQR